MIYVKVLRTFRIDHTLYTLSNIQIDQAQLSLSEGKHSIDEVTMAETHETHKQTLSLWLVTLDEHHHKTEDVHHKLTWHLHTKKRKYLETI